MDRERIINLLALAMVGTGGLGTLLPVVAPGQNWLPPVATLLLVLFVAACTGTLLYYVIPLGIPWIKVRSGVARLIQSMNSRGFAPEVVIGVGRAGSIVGAAIAANMGHCPFIALDVQHNIDTGVRRVTVNGPLRLLVDELKDRMVLLAFGYVKSRETAQAVLDYLSKKGLSLDHVSVATLFLDPDAPPAVRQLNFHFAFRKAISEKRWGAVPWHITKQYDYR